MSGLLPRGLALWAWLHEPRLRAIGRLPILPWALVLHRHASMAPARAARHRECMAQISWEAWA